MPVYHSDASIQLLHTLCEDYEKNTALSQDPRENPHVKRGLRNADGTGVMVGYTQIGNVRGYSIIDGETVPIKGSLTYRGYEIEDLIDGFSRDGRFGYAEISYLLLFGCLPTPAQLAQFENLMSEFTTLPDQFTEDMILRAPSSDIMNKLGRAVLALYSYDPNPDDVTLENMVRQCLELICRFPVIIAHAYAVKRHYYNNESLYLHRAQPHLSSAENFLHCMRPDSHFTDLEAKLLDICLVLHAEHGGGNNSTFACRVLASTGTDTYSAIAAAVGSLKGPKHGGANRQVMRQFEEICQAVSNWEDDGQVADYLRRILNKEVGDGSGLIYGMGHAVYTLSDPRTGLLKKYAWELAAQNPEMAAQLRLMERVERLAPEVFASVTGKAKVMCANVDMYSGLVYRMLRIPPELFTPVFAAARVAGWCAHRIEEQLTGGRLIRPAYKAVVKPQSYVPLAER